MSVDQDDARTADLRAQWAASQDDIVEAVQILEALLQKFDVDPAFTGELEAAVTQLGEELLAAEADTTQPQRSVRRKRPRDLN
jgi:hypothetical protein